MSCPRYTDAQIQNAESTETQIITSRQINKPLIKCLHLSLIYWKRGSIILYIANELSLFVKFDTDLKHMLGIEVTQGPTSMEGYVFFVSFRIFFSDNTSVRILIFFCRAKRKFFFKKLTLGYMTKTLNQIIFFPPPKSEYFFQQHWESKYFVRKNT